MSTVPVPTNFPGPPSGRSHFLHPHLRPTCSWFCSGILPLPWTTAPSHSPDHRHVTFPPLCASLLSTPGSRGHCLPSSRNVAGVPGEATSFTVINPLMKHKCLKHSPHTVTRLSALILSKLPTMCDTKVQFLWFPRPPQHWAPASVSLLRVCHPQVPPSHPCHPPSVSNVSPLVCTSARPPSCFLPGPLSLILHLLF